MASLESIRDGIKTTLESAVGVLTAYDTVPDVTNLPAVVCVPDTADFDVAMGRGTDTWEFDLYVLVGTADMGLGQDALDGFITGAGPNSIRAAVFANRNLGLGDCNATITGMSDYGAKFAMADLQHLGAILRLVVHTSGTA